MDRNDMQQFRILGCGAWGRLAYDMSVTNVHFCAAPHYAGGKMAEQSEHLFSSSMNKFGVVFVQRHKRARNQAAVPYPCDAAVASAVESEAAPKNGGGSRAGRRPRRRGHLVDGDCESELLIAPAWKVRIWLCFSVYVKDRRGGSVAGAPPDRARRSRRSIVSGESRP
eukprot:804772-Pleurochrysis_carterae.AAC.2